MKRYHFDFGNSGTDVIGMCAAVFANSREEAVLKLCAALPEHVDPVKPQGDVQYATVYLNPDNINKDHIDSEEEQA